jgi:hypothetical protein
MKKTIVILVVLVLAGPLAMWADPQDELLGKVVRLSGAVNGLGVVLLYKAGSCIILEEVDGSKRQAFDLKNRDYRLVILAESREAYAQMQADGLSPAEIAARAKLIPASLAFQYLSAIAKNARDTRIGAAISTSVFGIVISSLGICALLTTSGIDNSNYKFILANGLFVGGVGVLHLSLKSSAERRYEQAWKLSDEERDAFCADALKKEYRKAQTARLIEAGLYFGVATFFLVAKPWQGGSDLVDTKIFNFHSAFVFGLSGLVHLFLRNYEETAYRRYLEEKAAVEPSNKLVWNVGLVPRGFALGVNYYF